MMVGNTGTDDKSKDSSGKKNKDGQVKSHGDGYKYVFQDEYQ